MACRCCFGLGRGDKVRRRHHWWGEAPERLYDVHGGTGLLSPKVPATPIRLPSRGVSCEQGKTHWSADPCDHFLAPDQETSDTVDPRLGTPIGLARLWDSPASVHSLILSGRSGASPHQICVPHTLPLSSVICHFMVDGPHTVARAPEP
jgi:hypothetical protein